ncbi:tetratricopeptide repeat-containing sensor histidine kinase [Niabella drilacis]|uniref:Oxygen sensor histidine kinase NreB n=1 Tax=Niabella drilacis (strain DSM 25811 / CCM 8410 / CCUG 62505 / LMG 26954 / E90) TaxID=1285928 RepID=A0A1G6Z5Z9_NIADE|nr:sensor histidine kinase [Niabella drilacis]SDD97951.1 Signal transduction histidine kinase [Niabella drilacis]
MAATVSYIKKSSFLFAILWHAVNLFAQYGSAADSLLQLANHQKTDTAKARILYLVGDELSATDTARASRFIQQGLHLSGNRSYYQGLAYFYWGRLYMDYDIRKGEAFFDQALSLLSRHTTPASYRYQSRSWANKGVIAQYQNDNQTFIDIVLNQSIPLALKAGDSLAVAQGYTNLSLPFLNFGNFEKAILYAGKSIAIFQRNQPRDLRQADNFINLAKIYLQKEDNIKARANLDSALSIIRTQPGSLYDPYYYTTEAQYYINTHQPAPAMQNIDKGLSVARKIKSRNDLRTLLYQKARLFQSQHKTLEARDILLQLYRNGYITTDLDRKQIYRDLATTEADLQHMTAAFDWLSQYAALSDSMNDVQTRVQIARLEAKFNYVQKENELLAISSKVKTQRIIMWGSIGGLLLASLLFVYFSRLRRSRAEQQVRSLKQEQEIAVTQALLQGEEKERARMARDLHDGLGGMLAGVKINLTNALHDDPSSEINRVIIQLDDSVTELRRIARNMMPEALLRSGLRTALSDLCQSLSNEQLRVDFSFMNISNSLPRQVQIIIYRIIQELLANIVKHSGASEAFVQCSQDGTVFFITVEDNGSGINPDDHGNRRGIGLDNIRSRVDFLKGSMDLHSEPGKGTIVNIELRIHDNP